jgi:hypothetical protein
MRKILSPAWPFLAGILFFISCSPYGDKVEINSKSEVYIKDGGNKEDAKRLGEFLLDINYFDEQVQKSVQLVKSKDTFVVKFVINEEKLKGNPQAESGFSYMHMLLRDSVFSGKPTKVVLTDEKFKTIRSIQELSSNDINTINEAANDTTTAGDDSDTTAQ